MIRTAKEIAEILRVPCQYCGGAVAIQIGRYGEYLRCQNQECSRTRRLPMRSFPKPKPRPKVCCFKKCDGSGLIPFVNSKGEIVPHTHLFCDCHPDYGIDHKEQFIDLQPSDFDFPMSDSFYRDLCRQHGWHEPPPSVPVGEPEPIQKPLPMREPPIDLVQLKAQVNFLQNKVAEMGDKKKKGGSKYS